MAKLFSKYGASAFGEAFVSSYELEKRINERRQELEQEYNFKRRQMSLDEAYRRKQMSLDESQEERLREQAVMNAIGSGFRLVQEGLVEGRQNIRTGEYETMEPTIEAFGQNFAYPIQEQKQPEKKKFGEGIIRGGKYSTWGVPGEEEVTRYYLGEGETKGGKGEKPYKEPELEQWQVQQGLNYLQNPSLQKYDKEEKEYVDMTSEELQTSLDNAINNLAAGYLDSETQRWLYDQKAQYGRYPSPEELAAEISESGKAGELSEKQGQMLNSFLNQYYKGYGGVRKIQIKVRSLNK